MAHKISQQDIDTYRRDGAVLLKQVMPADWVSLIAEGLEEVYAAPGKLTSRATDAAGPGEIRIDQIASTSNAKIARVVTNSPAAAIAADLLGSDRVHYVLDQTFYKPSGRILPTPWHQDTPYLRVAGDDLVRLWICCDKSAREVTVHTVRGSHRWNVEYRPVEAEDGPMDEIDEGFSYRAPYDPAMPKVPDISGHPESFDILRWDVEPGDVLAFNGNVLHGTLTEFEQPIPRRALAVLWAGQEARCVERRGHTVPDAASARDIALTPGKRVTDCPEAFPLILDRARA